MTTANTAILLSATLRTHNNGDGLAAFVASRWQAVLAKRSDGPALRMAASLMPDGTRLPDGAVTSDVIPVAITSAQHYHSPDVQAWSRIVTAARAVVILSCQYNRGYPGPLKNTLDHLFNEWRDKPVLIVTYGGHGGNFAAAQLITVVRHGLRANVINGGDNDDEAVQITLPPEYIRGTARVGANDDFLKQYKDKLDAGIEALLDAVDA